MCSCITLSGWALTNYGLILFGGAALLSILQWSAPHKLSTSEILYRWMAVFPIGLASIIGFFAYSVYPNLLTPARLGWEHNIFQYDIGAASLGFGLMAILSFDASYGFRLATVIGSACWLWGNAIGDLFNHPNTSLIHMNSWFWLEVIIPFIMITCIASLKPRKNLF